VIGLGYFVTPQFLAFYLYYGAVTATVRGLLVVRRTAPLAALVGARNPAVNHDELGNLGLSDHQENALVAFMETLTDDYAIRDDGRCSSGTGLPIGAYDKFSMRHTDRCVAAPAAVDRVASQSIGGNGPEQEAFRQCTFQTDT
jgi:hypothetical protein